MADIDNVVKGLECCMQNQCPSILSDAYYNCPYTTGMYCNKSRLCADAIKVINDLQAQLQHAGECYEEAEKELKKIVHCKDCKHFDNPQKCHIAKMCRDANVDRFLLKDGNWYCADGEKEK